MERFREGAHLRASSGRILEACLFDFLCFAEVWLNLPAFRAEPFAECRFRALS